MFSVSHAQDVTRRALAAGALEPIETQTTLLDDGGVRFVVRAVSSLVRKDRSRHAAIADPLGNYEPSLFVADLGHSHYLLLNKFPVLARSGCLPSRISVRSPPA